MFSFFMKFLTLTVEISLSQDSPSLKIYHLSLWLWHLFLLKTLLDQKRWYWSLVNLSPGNALEWNGFIFKGIFKSNYCYTTKLHHPCISWFFASLYLTIAKIIVAIGEKKIDCRTQNTEICFKAKVMKSWNSC